MTPRRRTFSNADLDGAASVLRRLLVEVDNPEAEALVASRAVRYRLEGAVLALEAIVSKGTVAGEDLLVEPYIQNTDV
jgi:hypothetical protein